MNMVNISQTGVIKNILSLNYTHGTTMREYLNNILDKNKHPDHSVHFTMKEFYNFFMFECCEENACGFTNLNEVRRAFSIADSDRRGTNNMGYGIFSPITINNGHDAYGLFIQENENGSYYSLVYFNHKYCKLWTHSGELSDGKISGKDISDLIIPGGTRFIWITHPNIDKEECDSNISLDFVTMIVKDNYKKSFKYPVMGTGTTEDTAIDLEDVKDLGSYYSEYLLHTENPRSIFYGGEPIEPINFLINDSGKKVKPVVYDIRVAKNDRGFCEFQIKDSAGEWKLLTTTGIGKRDGKRRLKDTGIQTACLKVYDIGMPTGTKSRDTINMRRAYRKIWVKIDHTYIFPEDFPMNGWPNSRVVLELNNKGDNNFNDFISPDPNKSNSSINVKLKERIVPLIKKALNTHFSSKPKEMVSTALKHQVWETTCGNVLKCHCTNDDCANTMTAWCYDVRRIDPLQDNLLENLKPICKECTCSRE